MGCAPLQSQLEIGFDGIGLSRVRDVIEIFAVHHRRDLTEFFLRLEFLSIWMRR